MPTNLDRAATIRAATLAAVEQRNRLNDTAVDELIETYDDAGDLIVQHIERAAGQGDRVGLEQLQNVLSHVREELRRLQERRDGQLYRRIEQSACVGAGVFAGALPESTLFAVNHSAVAFVRSFTAADGLQLSDRLWRLNRNAAQVLTDHIQFAVINGESAHQAMLRSMGRGAGVPADIASAYNGARGGNLGRRVRSLMTGEADPVNGKGVVYQAERVFRSEINRAHGEAYMGAAFQVDGVAGVRFRLSPNHRVRDVCDTHATADRYGLGPGVYPSREACPWPAHPNTLSYVELVFADGI
ncbi:hypothetical protein CXB49_10640 [Chromobacterium sp. ATCC 53434]|uniref:hypothetical protein n=1 Tax=Chromobacterium sp. (strain ATCC 53434 / SC 14030) TaxID=2059672 RepID=UPI000C773143|nr:hypothetical protein [Chromobacterium sp. ATCC 53434]AUH51235.1 hypothetical protein CXB49_10640 [Chromobacterium sp. ATCC 53434]